MKKNISEAIREFKLTAHLFESMELINKAIHSTKDLEQMMCNALDAVLTIFNCDQAFLISSTDQRPEVANVIVTRTTPGDPELLSSEMASSIAKLIKEVQQDNISSQEPVFFRKNNLIELNSKLTVSPSIKSLISMALYLPLKQMWQLGAMDSSQERVWSAVEIKLFKEIGLRMQGALSLLLAYQELKKSESDYSRIVNMATEGIWVLNADGKTTFVNPRMAEMLGYTSEEMLDRVVTDFMIKEDLPDFHAKMASRWQDASSQYERRYCHKNGQIVWVLVSATALLNEKQRFTGGFGMMTDITAKKQVEEDLRRLNEDLETKIEERTFELNNALKELKVAHINMLQQEKMASIGQLAAGIAHEINTPVQFVSDNIIFLRESVEELLTGILAHQQTVVTANERTLISEIQKDLQTILDNIDVDYLKEEIPLAIEASAEGIKRISSIVSSMKDFAHPSGDKLEPVDLGHIIHTTVEISRNTWKMCAELNIDLSVKPLLVNGLRDELGQVLLNLIINAADAIADMPQDKGALGHISITTRMADDNWAEIVVKDSGSGIPVELQQRIFEPFFTTKSVGQGSGQGLAIAYNIVRDKHGGDLLVKSLPGKGCTFIIRLPLIAALD